MKAPVALLIILIAILATLVFAALNFDSTAATEVATDVPGLNIGASQLQRDKTLFWPGLVFGLLVIAALTNILWFGTLRTGSRRFLQALILCWAGGLMAAFVGVMVAFRNGETAPYGWFPPATNWVLGGIWLAPLALVLIYVGGFQTWYGTGSAETQTEVIE